MSPSKDTTPLSLLFAVTIELFKKTKQKNNEITEKRKQKRKKNVSSETFK